MHKLFPDLYDFPTHSLEFFQTVLSRWSMMGYLDQLEMSICDMLFSLELFVQCKHGQMTDGPFVWRECWDEARARHRIAEAAEMLCARRPMTSAHHIYSNERWARAYTVVTDSLSIVFSKLSNMLQAFAERRNTIDNLMHNVLETQIQACLAQPNLEIGPCAYEQYVWGLLSAYQFFGSGRLQSDQMLDLKIAQLRLLKTDIPPNQRQFCFACSFSEIRASFVKEAFLRPEAEVLQLLEVLARETCARIEVRYL